MGIVMSEEKELAKRRIDSERGAELRKPHEMVVMIPRSKRVTLTGRKIYNALLHYSQDQLGTMEKMPAADFMFRAPLQSILKTSGSSSETRTVAKRYLREMRGLEVDWETTASGDGMKWKNFSMLAEVAIEVKNGENWVLWTFPPTLMSALQDPIRWARIDLDVLTKLSTYAAVALYEICARYRDNPGGLTSRKPVAWWANALSQAPAGSERREWRKFKSEKVKAAIDEINADTDLQIDLIEHKLGRSVTEVQFAVRKKRVVARSQGSPEPVKVDFITNAETLGINEQKIEDLIKEFGEAAVQEKLNYLKLRLENDSLKKIDNRVAYLRSILKTPASEQMDVDVASMRPSKAIETANRAPSLSPIQQKNLSSDEWLKVRRAEISLEIQNLSNSQKERLFQTVMEKIAKVGLMTPVLKRRAMMGDMMHGLLGVYSVNCYATEVYGEDWVGNPPAEIPI